MAVKRERDSSVRDVLYAEKPESAELDRWTTPVKSSLEASECWKAPIKAEKSHVSSFVKEEKCGVGVAAAHSTIKEINWQPTESPLRCCPNFESMSDSADEVYSKIGEEENRKLLSSTFMDEDRDYSLGSPGEFLLNFKKLEDTTDDDLKGKTRVDFSGMELVHDCEDEDDNTCIIGSKYGVVNTRCPLSGKLVTELEDPVQSVSCHHVYDQASAKAFIEQSLGVSLCAVAGCSKPLIQSDLLCDTTLMDSIRDLRQKESTAKLKLLMECIHIDDD